MEIPYLAFVVGASSSFLVCLVLVLTKPWHGRFTLDGMNGIQKIHATPTPRVGGLGIMAGLVMGWLYVVEPTEGLLTTMIVAGLPAFVFGIAEDLTKRVRIRDRLLATMASGVVAWWISGITLTHIDIWGVDHLFQWVPLSVAFMAFSIGGVANSINIIDGFNGLASGVVMIGFVAFGLIAYQVGDLMLVNVCVVLFGVVLGFFIINFPFGKIFLGDGGAYLLGFLLAWLAVLLPMRNPDVSVWAGALVCGYPVLEVLFSMARRYRRQDSPGKADRLHMHSLIQRRVSRRLMRRWPASMRNASVSPFVWVFASVPALLAVVFWASTVELFFSIVACAVIYSGVYMRLVRFRW